MKYRIYALYASLKGEKPWMIAAEDEYCWEANPDRCEAVFTAARKLAERNDWDVREVTLVLDIDAVYKAFRAPEIDAEAEA